MSKPSGNPFVNWWLGLPGFDAPRYLVAQMELLENSFSFAMFGCFLASILWAWAARASGSDWGVAAWPVAMGLACGGAFWGRLAIADRLTRQVRLYAILFAVAILVLGLLWGGMAWNYLNFRSPPHTVAMMVIIAGMNAAALATFSPCFPVAVSFFVGSLLPAWSVLLFQDDADYLPLILAVPLYLAVLLVFARHYALAARKAIDLRFENLDLVHRLQEQTSRAEAARLEAEGANRAKSVFLASASHDLRQPMHALGLFVVALGRTPMNEEQQTLLSHINSSAGAAREMLNTLLDFSKIEAGVVVSRPKPFRLQPLLYDLANEFAPQAESKGLVYRARETSGVVLADPVLVEMVVRNFITNAIRYTARGGVLVACRNRGARLVVEVWDTGIGIPPGQFREIFQEFRQLANPERDRRKGLGLGLAIVDRLATTMGAQVSLASEPGRGSVFRLALPHSEAYVVDDALPSDDDPVFLAGLQVLVVDDDEHVRHAMESLLQSWKARCVAVDSAAEALTRLPGFSPDLILVDYRLRDNHTGQEALAAIRAQLGREVPAIIITGDTAPDRIREAHAAEALLLHKPVSSRQLFATMAHLLRHAGA